MDPRDTADVKSKVIDLEEMDNQDEGTVRLKFTPTNIRRIDKVFLLDFVADESRASLFLETIDDEPYLSVRAEGDEEIEWKQKVGWRDNQRVLLTVTWDDGSLKIYVDQEPFKAINLETLGFQNVGEKLVIGSDYENHYPGDFNVSL